MLILMVAILPEVERVMRGSLGGRDMVDLVGGGVVGSGCLRRLEGLGGESGDFSRGGSGRGSGMYRQTFLLTTMAAV